MTGYDLRRIWFAKPNSAWAASWENQHFAYAKTKALISFAVTAKLISAFVFATRIVQSLCFLNPKFQVSSHLLWLYSLVWCQTWSESILLVFSRCGSHGHETCRKFHFSSGIGKRHVAQNLSYFSDWVVLGNKIHRCPFLFIGIWLGDQTITGHE